MVTRLVRIAARIAKVRLAYDKKPPFVSFLVKSHVYSDDVQDSLLDESLKQAFLEVLQKKSELQDAYNGFEFKPSEKAFDRMAFMKPGIVDALRLLMEAVKPKLERWVPRFDTTFEALAAYEFPFETENSWYVDTWVQYVHELITAMFIACGGATYKTVSTDDIPKELRQPDWEPDRYIPTRTWQGDSEKEVKDPVPPFGERVKK